jgi:hypothetical protein
MKVPRPNPDFWGLLQKYEVRLHTEAAKVTSDAEMKKLISRWLNPRSGILSSAKKQRFYAQAKPSAQKIFTLTLVNAVRQVKHQWQTVWR